MLGDVRPVGHELGHLERPDRHSLLPGDRLECPPREAMLVATLQCLRLTLQPGVPQRRLPRFPPPVSLDEGAPIPPSSPCFLATVDAPLRHCATGGHVVRRPAPTAPTTDTDFGADAVWSTPATRSLRYGMRRLPVSGWRPSRSRSSRSAVTAPIRPRRFARNPSPRGGASSAAPSSVM